MKKFFIVLLLLFNLITLSGQTYQTTMYKTWELIGTPSWTTTSFYYCVTRSAYKINGYWIFDVYFTSNSYTWDYYSGVSHWRYVQLDGCIIYYDRQPSNYGVPLSFSFIKDFNPSPLRWATTNPNPTIHITWSKYYTL